MHPTTPGYRHHIHRCDLRDAEDNTRNQLLADPRLQRWADEWRDNLDPEQLDTYDVALIKAAVREWRHGTVAQFVTNFRRRMFTESAEFDTLVSDLADGEDLPRWMA